MIDIKPFEEKLKLLQEYLFLKIDRPYSAIWINLSALELIEYPNPKEILKSFFETGNLITPITFDEYYKSKTETNCNQ